MTIKALLFDKDGTLFEFTKTWSGWTRSVLQELSAGDASRFAGMAAAIGFDLSSDRYEKDSVVIAGTTAQIVECLSPFVPDFSRQALQQYLDENAAQLEPCEAVPLKSYLQDLRGQGYRLGVMTNDSEASARRQLHRVGVVDQFDLVIGADSGFGAKPSPDPLLAFCADVGVTASATAMVGDSLHDLVAGRAAGMTTIAVLTGIANRETLNAEADVVLPDIGHIPDWLMRRSRISSADL